MTHAARGMLHLCGGRVGAAAPQLAALHVLDVSAFCAFECESFDAPANARCPSCAECGILTIGMALGRIGMALGQAAPSAAG